MDLGHQTNGLFVKEFNLAILYQLSRSCPVFIIEHRLATNSLVHKWEVVAPHFFYQQGLGMAESVIQANGPKCNRRAQSYMYSQVQKCKQRDMEV